MPFSALWKRSESKKKKETDAAVTILINEGADLIIEYLSVWTEDLAVCTGVKWPRDWKKIQQKISRFSEQAADFPSVEQGIISEIGQPQLLGSQRSLVGLGHFREIGEILTLGRQATAMHMKTKESLLVEALKKRKAGPFLLLAIEAYNSDNTLTTIPVRHDTRATPLSTLVTDTFPARSENYNDKVLSAEIVVKGGGKFDGGAILTAENCLYEVSNQIYTLDFSDRFKVDSLLKIILEGSPRCRENAKRKLDDMCCRALPKAMKPPTYESSVYPNIPSMNEGIYSNVTGKF